MKEIEGINKDENWIKQNIFRIVLPISCYFVFLVSHFLIWGFFVITTVLPYTTTPFTGLEIKTGISSMIFLNGLFILGYVVFLIFKVTKPKRKVRSFLLFDMLLLILITGGLYIFILLGVFYNWPYYIILEGLGVGFYVWVVSVVGNMGILGYFLWKIVKGGEEGLTPT